MEHINAYLTFDGTCREAMTFYQKCLGADLYVMPFSQVPGDIPEEAKDRIMHARLAKGPAILMASDTMPGRNIQPGNNFSVAIQCENIPEIENLFSAFAEKGTVTMPLEDMFWGARFGMIKDQFGIQWMFNCPHSKEG
jgi:PhnB protein